jgi:16S rRNA (cytidine1402-2'-O)-methyltransferase
VAAVAAEDTRHTAVLLRHYGLHTPALALHEHNEQQVVPRLLARLRAGEALALVSDAGTPLVSDPGRHLVAEAQAAGVPVRPIPGPAALIAALSVAGFPADRFVFEGFLPARAAGRRARLQALAGEERTLVFYEAPHRIRESLRDLAEVFGGERPALVGRELTKVFEEARRATLAELETWLREHPDRERGEFVVVLDGREPGPAGGLEPDDDRVLRVLLDELPASTAATLAARLTGKPRRALYARAVELSARRSGGEGTNHKEHKERRE